MRGMPIIRKEYYEDWDAIRTVHERAFGQSTEADIIEALRNANGITLSLVAEDSRAVVGHILFSPVTVKGSNVPMAALGPMAVLPRIQRHGIGTLLVRSGMIICREVGMKAIIVLGHPNFYSRFGFAPASGFGLAPSWSNVPDDAFMALELVPGALAQTSGTVQYATAFDMA